jgi:single-strand DNA-binding protein
LPSTVGGRTETRGRGAKFLRRRSLGPFREAINQYLLKGKQVAVEGELRQDRWEQDGQNRSKVEIQANNVQLLGGGSGGGSGGAGAQSGGYAPRDRAVGPAPKSGGPSAGDGGDDGFTDDIPF